MAPRLLILSFSSIAGDARVLKQVRLFAERYEVTTCGFGPTPEGVAEHLELAPESAGLMPDGCSTRSWPTSRTPGRRWE